jgi:uncharacterized DUF497 family protein
MSKVRFEWDAAKDSANQAKHGVSFAEAQYAFEDMRRVIAEDVAHSTETERRYLCFGQCGGGVLTVRFTYRRFTYRNEVIRIFGAGYWRRGLQIYEKVNQVRE